jgi:type III pantothenate kinase
MDNLLAIDVGNTNVKYGHFVDGHLVADWRHELNETAARCADIIGSVDAPVAIASVVPEVGGRLLRTCRRKSLARHVFQITTDSQSLITGMNREMGADRVADAFAAYKLYGMCKRPVLVMGFGTATTLLAISAEGHVAGGWIAPGMRPTLEVLHDRCALLPLLAMEGQTESFGFDTASHMRNGVFLGHVGMAEKWLEVGRKLFAAGSTGSEQGALAIATGGWATTVDQYAHIFDTVDPLLTLKGVYLIAQAAGVGSKQKR